MTQEYLLPSNASALERSLSLTLDPAARLVPATDALRSFKTMPGDALLPWLIWEYGLGEVLPYLPEPRRAIAEGILWQRLRGTPAALTTALVWIGATATVEQEPHGVHFAEFQLDPGKVLDSDRSIADLIAIARLSAPARSRLSRIYHGCDLRRFVLDDSLLGEALLSDHSGVLWVDGLTKLSFGRVRTFAHSPLPIDVQLAGNPIRSSAARLLDRYLLDWSALGDAGHTLNEAILHAHLFTLANFDGGAAQTGWIPERRFCRALVVLSDSTVLGDLNACTPRFVWREDGGPIVLGNGGRLSATLHRLVRAELLERLAADHVSALLVPSLMLTASRESRSTHRVQARSAPLLGDMQTGERAQARDELAMRREHHRINAPLGSVPDWRARLFQRAQIVLSDSTALGDVNCRSPRGRQTEMFIRQQVGRGNPALATTPSGRSHLRLLTRAANATLGPAAEAAHGHLTSGRAAWIGQTWTGTRWPATRWNDTREVIGAGHLSLQ
jgi:hypothetical protein